MIRAFGATAGAAELENKYVYVVTARGTDALSPCFDEPAVDFDQTTILAESGNWVTSWLQNQPVSNVSEHFLAREVAEAPRTWSREGTAVKDQQ